MDRCILLESGGVAMDQQYQDQGGRQRLRLFDEGRPLGDRVFWALLVAIALLGLALRLPHLSSRSLWLDEAYSAWFAAQPLHTLWTSVPLYETHPPMYYTLLKGWTALFGQSEAALRAPSVLAGVVTVVLLALAGRALRAGPFGDRAALLAAFLLAINQGAVYHAQQARPYALEALAASAAILSALILLQRLRAEAGRQFRLRPFLPSMMSLGVSTAATMWMHNTGIMVAFGLWTGLLVAVLFFVPGRRLHQMLVIVLPGILALLLWSPFLPMFIRQNSGMATLSYWVVFSPWDLLTAWFLAAGGYLPLIPAIFLFLVGIRAVALKRRPDAALVLVVLLLPLATILAISYFLKPVYIDRLFEWMAPTFVALVAIGMLADIPWQSLRQVTTLLFIVLGCFSTFTAYSVQTEDWRGIVARIADNAEPGDLVIASPNELDPPVHYYAARHRSFPELLTVPASYPALGLPRVYVSNLGAPKIMPADRQLVREAMKTHRRVWLIERGTNFYDPDGLVRAEVLSVRRLVSSQISDSVSLDLFE